MCEGHSSILLLFFKVFWLCKIPAVQPVASSDGFCTEEDSRLQEYDHDYNDRKEGLRNVSVQDFCS